MGHSIQPEPDFRRSSFVQCCAYCGARFEVLLSRQAGEDAHEEYACPECSKGYSTHAALPPLVSLLSRRSDGKSDTYQETMF